MSQHIDPPMNQSSIVDNLTTDDGTKALSAKQGKALNGKIENIDTDTVINDLSVIPLNSQGRIRLAAAISPTGVDATVNYSCIGTSARPIIIAHTINNSYRNTYNGTSWTGWKEIVFNDKFADLGAFTANTVTEFMTSAISAIANYPNGRYVFSATWQSQSVYVIVANKVSNTRIIGNATPQIQNGKDMFAFSLEGTTVNIYPIALTSNLNGLRLIKITKTVTVPAGGSVDVDFSSSVPAGTTVFAISNIMLGNYVLPYISGSTYTWVELINPSTKILRIKNTATVWTNYELNFVVFVA